ncbi:MAG: hypothetical protein AAFY60_03560 [Myxococcota bacterium]
MSVQSELLEAALGLWRSGAMARSHAPHRLAQSVRPRASGPGPWLSAVRAAHREFVSTVKLDSAMKRKHADRFFAGLAAATAAPVLQPLDGENSKAA